MNQTPTDYWQRPVGDYDASLWPDADLRLIDSQPVSWVTIEEYQSPRRSGRSGWCHSYLVSPGAISEVLAAATIPRESVGSSGVTGYKDDIEFFDGLSTPYGDGDVYFFSQVRTHEGKVKPHFEITPTFLWFWGAYPVEGGWSYVDEAGNEIELIRVRITDDDWLVDVSALELRTFLHVSGRRLVIQVDNMYHPTDKSENPSMDSESQSDWFHLNWVVRPGVGGGFGPDFSSLFGVYIIEGAKTSRLPSYLDDHERDYPAFIYDVNPETGVAAKFTCDQKQLANYYGKNPNAPHYLTPICFRREVLARYTAEPSKYNVSPTRVERDGSWGIEIGINTAGLVTAYLGDLGRDLPESERPYWLTFNVLPAGKIEEGQFRRDFLNQFASSPNPVLDLREARARCNDAMKQVLGKPLWKPLPDEQQLAWDHLFGPVQDEPASLNGPLLTLTICLVDAIDPKPLTAFLGGANDGEGSLSLLTRCAERLGDLNKCTEPLLALQSIRSKAGIAHLASSDALQARKRLGIEAMTPWNAFVHVVHSLTCCLNELTTLAQLADYSSGEGEVN